MKRLDTSRSKLLAAMADAPSTSSEERASLESHSKRLAADLARARSIIGSLPNEEDYHFYKLFPDFKQPNDAAGERIKKLLLRFGSREEWSDEPDEAAEWLVTVMDDLLEQVRSCVISHHHLPISLRQVLATGF